MKLTMKTILILTTLLPSALTLPQSPHTFSTLDNPAFFNTYIENLTKDINATYFCPRVVPKLGPSKITDWTELPESCLICCVQAIREGMCINRQMKTVGSSAFGGYLKGIKWPWGAGEGVDGGSVRKGVVGDCVDGEEEGEENEDEGGVDGRGQVCGKCRYCLDVSVQRAVLEDGYCG